MEIVSADIKKNIENLHYIHPSRSKTDSHVDSLQDMQDMNQAISQ